jgi:hypothetical protein
MSLQVIINPHLFCPCAEMHLPAQRVAEWPVVPNGMYACTRPGLQEFNSMVCTSHPSMGWGRAV